MNRLNHLPTLRIDPSRPVFPDIAARRLSGCRRRHRGHSAFANGVRIFGRSLKYHRPRGLYSLDGECSNTCMAGERHSQRARRNHPAQETACG
jgi:sarcosine oxidase subunit alpha